MGTAKDITHKTLIDHKVRIDFKLSINDYCVADFVRAAQTDPAGIPGWWLYNSKTIFTHLAKTLGISKATAYRTLKKLKSKGLIEFHPDHKALIRTTQKWYNATVGIKVQDETEILNLRQNFSIFDKEKVTPKEININTHSQNTSYSSSGGLAKKPPSCPLLNGSLLKAKYPKGHDECYEYLDSAQERRGFNFVNKAKQLNALHNILKAGFDFPQMNKTVPLLDNRYGRGNWDFTNMANWLEKGAAHAKD